MHAQIMALLSITRGVSVITETVFENRFMHVGELGRMGANIKIDGRIAIVGENCMEILNALDKYIVEKIPLQLLRRIACMLMIFSIINSEYKLFVIKGISENIVINSNSQFINSFFGWILSGCTMVLIVDYLKNNKITHLYVESSKTAATVIVFESLCDLILTSLFFVGSIYLFLVNQQLSMGMVIFFAIYLLMKIISFIEAEYKKTLEWVEYFRKKGSGYYYAEEKREIKLEDVVIYKSRLYTVIYQKNEWWLSQKGKKIILDSELVSLDDIMGKTPEDIRLYYY